MQKTKGVAILALLILMVGVTAGSVCDDLMSQARQLPAYNGTSSHVADFAESINVTNSTNFFEANCHIPELNLSMSSTTRIIGSEP